MWDFRNLIRRAGGHWPRDWRQIMRKPIPPPAPPPKPMDDEDDRWGSDHDEHWLPPGWKPPSNSADDWRDAD
jgi:hypothetical protein